MCFACGFWARKLRVSIRCSKTLKDAINEAIRDWVTNVEDTFYIFGSVLGPHPYPMIVRDFQRVIGVEARAQILRKRRADCPMYSSRVWAGEVILSGCFTLFWMMPMCR